MDAADGGIGRLGVFRRRANAIIDFAAQATPADFEPCHRW
jgi:hypothetical protein